MQLLSWILLAGLAFASNVTKFKRDSPCRPFFRTNLYNRVYPHIPAERPFICLHSIPLRKDVALAQIEYLRRVAQFQSTLDLLKSDESTGVFNNEPIDILAKLDDVADRIQSGDLARQFEFEYTIAFLFRAAKDAHLTFDGYLSFSAFRWARPPDFRLVSLDNGVHTYTNLEKGIDNPIVKINGEDVYEFLRKESEFDTHQDAHARFQSWVGGSLEAGSESYMTPSLFPGYENILEFADGTSVEDTTKLLQFDPEWATITTDDDVYERFVLGNGARLTKRTTPITHSNPRLRVAGYFMEDPKFGVLRIGSFKDDHESSETVDLVNDFIKTCKQMSITRVIIDLRGNGGGWERIVSQAAASFNPALEDKAVTAERFRSQRALRNICAVWEKFNPTKFFFTTLMHFKVIRKPDGSEYTTVRQLYTPTADGYSQTYFLNFMWSDEAPYRYESLPPASDPPPFLDSDIILLGDGICASGCPLFVNALKQTLPNIKLITVGGDPKNKYPMNFSGGTKGGMLLRASTIDEWSSLAAKYLPASAKDYLPTPNPVRWTYAAVNFQDEMNGPDYDTPLQFVNDESPCRILYTKDTYKDDEALWKQVYQIGFSGDKEGWNFDLCRDTPEKPTEVDGDLFYSPASDDESLDEYFDSLEVSVEASDDSDSTDA